MDNPHAKKLLSLDFGSFLLSFGVCWSIFAFSTILIGLEYAVVGILFGLTIGIFGSILFDSGLFVAMYQTGICLFLFNGLILININKIDILKEILGNYTRLSIILTVISLLFIFIGYPLRSFSKYTATNNKPETYQYIKDVNSKWDILVTCYLGDDVFKDYIVCENFIGSEKNAYEKAKEIAYEKFNRNSIRHVHVILKYTNDENKKYWLPTEELYMQYSAVRNERPSWTEICPGCITKY